MNTTLKKRGQKFVKRFSHFSKKAGSNSKAHLEENFFHRFSHIKNIRLLVFEWILLVSALIMLAITQAFWFWDSFSDNTFTTGGNFIEATHGKINSLNPLFAITSSEKTLSRLLFTNLSTIDYSGHIGLGLAQSITPDTGGKTWTLKLRDHLKWSDGTPITNADVIFTAQLIQNPAVDSIYSSNLKNVKVSEKDDAIIFSLPTPYADFISALDFPIVPEHILKTTEPKKLIEHDFSSNPVTSGPFKLNTIQTISADGEKIAYLVANPNYYKETPLLTNFSIHAYPEKSQIISAVSSGAVTATADLSATDQKSITNTKTKISAINSGAFIFFNLDRESVKNLDLRTAIRQGLNLDRIRAVAPDTTPLDFPVLSSQVPNLTYPSLWEVDQAKAKEKIAEITNEAPISLGIATVNTGYLPAVADEIAKQLTILGIEVNLKTYEEDQEFITDAISSRNYDLLVYNIELGANFDLLPYYHSTQATSAGLNLSNYKNNLVDDLLLAARSSRDETLRAKKCESFLSHWTKDVPAIALYQPNLTYYYNKNVRPFSDNIHLVTPLDRFSDVTSWATTRETKNRTP